MPHSPLDHIAAAVRFSGGGGGGWVLTGIALVCINFKRFRGCVEKDNFLMKINENRRIYGDMEHVAKAYAKKSKSKKASRRGGDRKGRKGKDMYSTDQGGEDDGMDEDPDDPFCSRMLELETVRTLRPHRTPCAHPSNVLRCSRDVWWLGSKWAPRVLPPRSTVHVPCAPFTQHCVCTPLHVFFFFLLFFYLVILAFSRSSDIGGARLFA